MISYMTWGIRTGWVLGHWSPASAEPGENVTWLLWTKKSRFLPTQQKKKMTVARIPPGHGLVGNPAVSDLSQGAPLPPMKRSALERQRRQMAKLPVFLERFI